MECPNCKNPLPESAMKFGAHYDAQPKSSLGPAMPPRSTYRGVCPSCKKTVFVSVPDKESK